MKSTMFFVIKLFFLWLIFFLCQRMLFYVHYWSDFDTSFFTLLKLPYHALRIDISSFAYLCGLPFIFLAISTLNLTKKWQSIFIKLSKGFIWFSAVISAVIFSSELVSYYEWRAKLSSKIFIHFETPSEIFRTSSGNSTWWFLLYLLLQLVVFYILYKWIIKPINFEETKQNFVVKFMFFIGFTVIGGGLFALGFRGGWQEIPISATNGYYTNSQITNDLSVNSTWNFIHMTYEYFNTDFEDYYNSVPEKEAKQLVQQLFKITEPDTLAIFKTDTPNIIFVTLEGWSAQMIEPLGGLKGVTPNFNQLTKEGLLFTQIYATSETSETGHTSIYSGYPTLPKISMSTESAKCRQMPSVIHALKQKNYSSSYYFGGALSYGNIGGYMTEIGWDRLTDENELQHLNPKGNLGIHDEAMFSYFYSEIKQAKRPYVYGLFTQSTHAPYDMDAPYLEEYPDDDYIKSMHYADAKIKIFTDNLKKLTDFNNTIVVFVADHGKTNLVNNNRYVDDFYHIPVLIWGGGLKNEMKGDSITKIGSQNDIVKTILNQLNYNTDAFNWSKDLLNISTKEWAIITTSYTYGIKTPSGCIIHQFIDEVDVYNSYTDTAEAKIQLKNCRAIIESVYREFKAF